MSTYKLATFHSDSIERSNCAKCGIVTRLFGIELDVPGHELLSFDCPKCHHIETRVGKIE
jgi:hypothetical protein